MANKLHPSVWLHFGAGILISLVFFLFPYYELELLYRTSFIISLLAGIIFASLKEWRDWSFRNEIAWKKWDWIDWWFTVGGSIVLPILIGLINWML